MIPFSKASSVLRIVLLYDAAWGVFERTRADTNARLTAYLNSAEPRAGSARKRHEGGIVIHAYQLARRARMGLVRLTNSRGSRVGHGAGAAAQAHFQAHWQHCMVRRIFFGSITVWFINGGGQALEHIANCSDSEKEKGIFAPFATRSPPRTQVWAPAG